MPNLNIKGFPEELYNNLVMLAKRERRSLTQEVIVLLQESIENSEKKKTSILNLRGLGKEIWKEVDTEGHINKERESWD